MINVEFEAPRTEGLADEAWAASRPALVDAMLRIVLALTNSFKRVVGGTGSGREYRRGKGGRTHRASAPGQPPARDMGDYVNSFDFAVDDIRGGTLDPNEVSGQVGSRLWEKRGKLLEFGTRRMMPRPHVDQAINDARPEIDRIIGAL